MKIYIVTIHPTKASKSSYLLGAYSTVKLAHDAAKAEVGRADASWWTNYDITMATVDRNVEHIEHNGNDHYLKYVEGLD